MLNDVNVWVIGLSTNQSLILLSSFQFVFVVVAKCMVRYIYHMIVVIILIKTKEVLC